VEVGAEEDLPEAFLSILVDMRDTGGGEFVLFEDADAARF
jgi:hypothetical protein